MPALARRAEVLAAYDEWEAAERAGEDAAGVTTANAESRAAWNEAEKPVRQRILDLRSADPATLRLKVRAYLDANGVIDWRAGLDDNVQHAVDQQGGPWEEATAASILRDIVTAHIGDAA